MSVIKRALQFSKWVPGLFLWVLVAFLMAIVAVFISLFVGDGEHFVMVGLGVEPRRKAYALEFVGAVAGGLVLAMAAAIAYRRAKAMENTVAQQERGLHHERLKVAVEHLGHDKRAIRIGAAFEMIHLAREVENFRPTVADILSTYVRDTTRGKCYRKKYEQRPSLDISLILHLVFERHADVFGGCSKRLEGSWLNGLWLTEGAHFVNVDLTKTFMVGANLLGADMRGAFLADANLTGACLQRVQLQGADLVSARMWGADLSKAQMQGTYVKRLELQAANLEDVRMHGAANEDKYLSSGCKRINERVCKYSDLSGAIYEGGVEKACLDKLFDILKEELFEELSSHCRPRLGFEKVPGSAKCNEWVHEKSGAIFGKYRERDARAWLVGVR